jgi:hypothetical protein
MVVVRFPRLQKFETYKKPPVSWQNVKKIHMRLLFGKIKKRGKISMTLNYRYIIRNDESRYPESINCAIVPSQRRWQNGFRIWIEAAVAQGGLRKGSDRRLFLDYMHPLAVIIQIRCLSKQNENRKWFAHNNWKQGYQFRTEGLAVWALELRCAENKMRVHTVTLEWRSIT